MIESRLPSRAGLERGSDAVPEGASDGTAGSPLESPVLRSAFGFDRSDDEWVALVRDSTARAPLGRFGPYELLAEVGRGSQGSVYKAVQPGTQRVIAIKRLAAGALATPGMRSRFEREVETVCRLSHPGIVTVHGVETIDGQPVLTMEYVDGTPIDRWAEGRAQREVLTVFADACDAVAHAHQRAVLHRDLKPSNILVQDRADAGRDREAPAPQQTRSRPPASTTSSQPKVLDFGLAKLVGAGGAAPTHSTGFVGTPVFASPEQIAGKADAVDTRSDVYSLGVILYRLLTGALPFDTDKGLPALFDQVRRGVARPPSAVRAGIGRELDAIVLKAMAAEPGRRYASADALGIDVRRFLAGDAVLAHAPSMAYELRTLIRRHRVAFGVGIAGALVVAVLTAVLAVMAARLAARSSQLSLALSGAQEAKIRAEQESARSSTNAEFLREMLVSLGRAVSDRQIQPEKSMIRDAISRLEAGGLADQPELEVQLWRQVARSALAVGMIAEGERCAQKALSRATEALGPDHAETGRCMLTWGYIAEVRSDSRTAEEYYRKSVETLERTLGEDHADTALAINNLASIVRNLGRTDESEPLYKRALDIRLRVLGPVHRDVGISFRHMGMVRLAQKRYDDARRFFETALEVLEQAGAPPADLRSVRFNFGRVARYEGRLEEAAQVYRQLADEALAENGPGGIDEGVMVWSLSDIRFRQKRYEESASLCAQALSAYRATYPPDHQRLIGVIIRHGESLLLASRAAEAEAPLREGAALSETMVPPSPPIVKRARALLAQCLRTLGRADEAAAVEALPEFTAPPAAAPDTAPGRDAPGDALSNAEDADERRGPR